MIKNDGKISFDFLLNLFDVEGNSPDVADNISPLVSVPHEGLLVPKLLALTHIYAVGFARKKNAQRPNISYRPAKWSI